MFAAALRQELLDNGITSTIMYRVPHEFDEALEIVVGEHTFSRRIWIYFKGSAVKVKMSGGPHMSQCDLVEPDSVEKIVKEVFRYRRLAKHIDG